MNRPVLVLLALLLQTWAYPPAPPPLPYYAHHVTCWCEKCDGFDEAGRWTAARNLVAYGTHGVPSTRLFSLAAGEKVKVLDGVVVVDRADRVRVLATTTLLGETAPLRPGDVFWKVQIGGEGAATVWHRGRMFGTAMDQYQDCQTRRPGCSGLIDEKAIRRWWVKVRNARGQIGWVRADWNFVDDTCGVRPR
jgi:hypothetical protein